MLVRVEGLGPFTDVARSVGEAPGVGGQLSDFLGGISRVVGEPGNLAQWKFRIEAPAVVAVFASSPVHDFPFGFGWQAVAVADQGCQDCLGGSGISTGNRFFVPVPASVAGGASFFLCGAQVGVVHRVEVCHALYGALGTVRAEGWVEARHSLELFLGDFAKST